jgi:hypothetical protein
MKSSVFWDMTPCSPAENITLTIAKLRKEVGNNSSSLSRQKLILEKKYISNSIAKDLCISIGLMIIDQLTHLLIPVSS